MVDVVVGYSVSLAIGIGFGLVPMIVARRKQAMKYGVSALALCALAGLLVGLIGIIPIAIILTGIAAACSPRRLKSLGEKEAGGTNDAAIAAVFIFLAIGILVIWAFQVDALG